MRPNPINPFGLNAREPHLRENKTPEELKTAECKSHGLNNCYHCTGRGIGKRIQKVRNELKSICNGLPAPGEPGRKEHWERIRQLQRQEARLVRMARTLDKPATSSTVNIELSRSLSRFFK